MNLVSYTMSMFVSSKLILFLNPAVNCVSHECAPCVVWLCYRISFPLLPVVLGHDTLKEEEAEQSAGQQSKVY